MAENQNLNNEVNDLYEEKVLFEWEAPERPYQKKVKILGYGYCHFDFSIRYFDFYQWIILIMALISVLFVYYALSSVPPGTVKNKLTNRAVYFGELRYEWSGLQNFWFKKASPVKQLILIPRSDFPKWSRSLSIPKIRKNKRNCD